ncbi:MAG: UvrD-helicase domain-containing protein [Lachnospiraceae bacterium]|nr:UvrD-helicase domain-containing protein [Lachnospiraceae bacterium]
MLQIHKASAGSGKTFTLTYNYIKLLLGEKSSSGRYVLSASHNRHRSILAITFTNKATDEMKRRIVAQLAALAGITGKKSDYSERLCREFDCDEDKLCHCSRMALTSLLADFTNFNVSTIDSFFQIVLRTFAREAELTGNYEVELDDKNAVSIGVNELLSMLNRLSRAELRQNPEKKALVSWLTRYMKLRIEEGKTFNIFNRGSSLNSEIVKFMQNAFSEEYRLNAADIDDYLADYERIINFSASLAAARRNRGKAFVDYAKEKYAILQSHGAIEAMVAHLKNNLERWTQGVLKITDYAYTCVHNPDKRFKKKYLPSMEVDMIVDELLAEAVKFFGDITLYSRLESEIYKLGLIGAVNRQVNELQNENNAILLRDTSDILRRIISEEEAPFIYERLGVRLSHFLIDEFQDTSRLQWENLSALVRESLSIGNDNLIIGDEKQSIYRFRNSDPDLLMKRVPEEFAERIEFHGNIPSENTNWRSAAEVVRFNNTVFKLITSAVNLDDIYANVVQEVAKKDLPGYVVATPYDDEEETLDRMAEGIKRQLAAGYRQGDITVLTATRNEGSRVVDYLLQRKISDPDLASLQVMSEDSLVIGRAYSVQLIVAVMRFIDSYRSLAPSERVAERLTAEEFEKRFRYYCAMGMERADAIAASFTDNSEMTQLMVEAVDMECISLPSLVERIAARCVSAGLFESENVYISAFQDKIIDFCERPGADLRSFMQWWDDAGCHATLDTPTEVNALRVMTIHKSKGLEFQCVHIPFVDWSLNSGKGLIWFDFREKSGRLTWNPFDNEWFDKKDIPPLMPLNISRELSSTALSIQYEENSRKEWIDTMNRAYVAFTRAVRELVIGYKLPAKNSKSVSISALLEDAFECADPLRNVGLTPSSDAVASLKEMRVPEGGICYGQPTSPEKKVEPSNMVAVPDYYTYDNNHIWDMSCIEDIADMSRPRQRGIVLHGLMSRIRTASDLHGAVRRAVVNGNIPEEDAGRCEDFLRGAMEDVRVAPWFNDVVRVLNERSVIVLGKSGSKRYRPDRVVWTAEGTIDVVDFKFGEEEPKKYLTQVKRYMAYLSKAFPDERVRGYLWYPLEKRVVEVEN